MFRECMDIQNEAFANEVDYNVSLWGVQLNTLRSCASKYILSMCMYLYRLLVFLNFKVV
jgi:hypothetical protein